MTVASGVPPRAPTVPWHVSALVLASTSAVVGVIWDISWHRTIGRDTFWTPAHLAIYLGGVLAGVTCGWLALRTTFAGAPEQRATGVTFWGFRAPLGAWVAIWGTIAMITSAPLDNWWHNAYGLDVKVLSPPHAVLAAGTSAIKLGALLLVLALQNREAAAARRPYSLLVAYLGGILLLDVAIMGIEQIGFPNSAHTSLYYKVAAGPPFPLLLVVPAVAVDLLMRRAGPHHDWTLSVLLGLALVALFFVAQWFFTEFLLTPHARNFLFGVDQWDYSSRLGPWRYRFWNIRADPVTARGLAIAAGLAVASARLGLWLGNGMARVKR